MAVVLNAQGARPPVWLLRGGGVGALMALALVALGAVSAFTILDEDMVEFLVFAFPLAAPLALTPTVAALAWLYRPLAPRASWMMLGLAVVGLGSFVLLPFLFVLSDTAGAPDPDLTGLRFLWYGLVMANGLWQVVAGGIGVRHAQLGLRAVSVSGIVAGGAWIAFVTGALLQSSPLGAWGVLDGLFLLSLVVLTVSQTIWAVGLGVRLLRYPATDG